MAAVVLSCFEWLLICICPRRGASGGFRNRRSQASNNAPSACGCRFTDRRRQQRIRWRRRGSQLATKSGRLPARYAQTACSSTASRTWLARSCERRHSLPSARPDGVLIRVDILEPDRGRWRLAEVKSSTSVKDYHLSDVATQVWTLEKADVPLSEIVVRHINREFVLEQEANYAGLFVDASVRELIAPLVESRPQVVFEARQMLCGDEPEQAMGDHCTDPFDCEFQAYCSRGIVEPQWPIKLLPNTGRRLAKHWADQGIFELLDVPTGGLTNPLHVRIYEATRTGRPFHNCEAAITATRDWAYPRTWVDFETIAFAVPRWVGTRPWEQIPFQFSAHIERDTGAVSHHEFLSLDGHDPRQSLAAALVGAVPASGAIIAYNASFERACLERLAAASPQFSAKLHDMVARLVDLLPIARSCWYHRDQRGSWSIKAVLPTVSEQLGYSDMEVAHGGAAQLAYLEAIGSTNSERRLELERSLRDYCRRDTEAMMELYRRLVTTT